MVPPPLNCCEPARVSPPSCKLLLLASTHTLTKEFASAVPAIVVLLALTVSGDAGLVTVGTAGGVLSTVNVAPLLGVEVIVLPARSFPVLSETVAVPFPDPTLYVNEYCV